MLHLSWLDLDRTGDLKGESSQGQELWPRIRSDIITRQVDPVSMFCEHIKQDLQCNAACEWLTAVNQPSPRSVS